MIERLFMLLSIRLILIRDAAAGRRGPASECSPHIVPVYDRTVAAIINYIST